MSSVSLFVLGGKSFYFYSIWKEKSFELYVSDARHVWHGVVSEDFMTNTLKPPDMDHEEYMRLTKKALTDQDRTKKQFTYKLSQGATRSDLQLTWRIKLGQSTEVGISLKGTLPLEHLKDGQKIVQQMMGWLIEKSDVLEKDNIELTEQNTKLRTQRDTAMSQLNKLVHEKSSMELEMYEKFALILNEKKEKIRQLKQDLSNRPISNLADVQSRSSDDEPEDNHRSQKSNPSKKNPFSLSGPTPTLSILDNDNYNVKATVRPRFKRPAEEMKSSTTHSQSHSQSKSSGPTSSVSVPENAAKRRRLEETKKGPSADDLLLEL